MSTVLSGELEGLETVARIRLSGSVVTGVGVCEYFEDAASAVARQHSILADAPKAMLEIADVQCVLDENGEVLAEVE